ncbi:PP2C family protein-serine/threonine phosphatase [Flavobacteriaceae bacterium M23B6Z8]
MAKSRCSLRSQVLYETGGRDQNEDAIYPADPNGGDRFFIVCDGVGGQRKGEVASALVCKYFAEYLITSKNFDDTAMLTDGLRYVEEKLLEEIRQQPEYSGMASTLTILLFAPTNQKAMLGWVGDSRIYQVRDGQILFQTKDHSEVQSLVDMGEITKEEALHHPKKNIITRAVNGRREARIDQHTIDDIEENDFFMLCTDGILENLNEAKIQEWFLKTEDAEVIKEKIYNNAVGRTKDNFSMILIKVENIERSGIKDMFTSLRAKLKL